MSAVREREKASERASERERERERERSQESTVTGRFHRPLAQMLSNLKSSNSEIGGFCGSFHIRPRALLPCFVSTDAAGV